MANWWQMSAEELATDEGARRARTLAHYNTFYGTEDGKQVLLGLQRMCYAVTGTAEAMLAKICLYQDIRAIAGVDVNVEKAAIDAEGDAIQIGE